jgi:hypothetical protein
MKKKLIPSVIGILSFLMGGLGFLVSAANPPKFDSNFVQPLTDKDQQIRVLNKEEIKAEQSLITNLQKLITPSTSAGIGEEGILARVVKNLAIGIIFMYLIFAGVQLIISGNKAEQLKDAIRNLLYISVGAIFIYGA